MMSSPSRLLRVYALCAVVALLLLPFSIVRAAAPDNIVWTPHNEGISGSSIVGLAIDPNDTSTLYALTSASGMYKSTDGGTSWAAANTGLPNTKAVSSAHLFGDLLTMDPNDSSVLYANFNGQIYKTSDGGDGWSLSHTGIPLCGGQNAIVGIAVDPTDSDHLLAGHTVAGCTGGIYESTDAGANWTHVETTGPINNDAWPLAFDSADPNNVYASPVHLGFMYSRDAGRTWVRVTPTFANAEGGMVAVHPTVTSRIFFGDITGIYYSTNGGVNWLQGAVDTGNVWDFAFSASNPLIGYAASDDGVYKTTDGGFNWSLPGLTSLLSPRTIEVDPTDPTSVYMGSSGSGMYHSSDGGVSFTAINEGIPISITISTTAIAPSDTDMYYASVSGLGFYRSDDRGYTWTQQSNSYSTVNSSNYILIDPNDEDTLYAGFAGIYKSTDAGVTWTAVNDPPGDQFFQAAALDPEDPQHLIIGDSSGFDVYESFNGGDDWAINASFTPSSYIMRIAFDPTDSNRVYGATYDSFWKSIDNGATWTKITSGLTAGAQQQVDGLGIDPTATSTLYIAVRTDEVMKSTDGGDSWSATGYFSDSIDTPNRIVMGPNGEIYVFSTYGWKGSSNGGTSFSARSTSGLDSAFFLFKWTTNIDPTDPTRFIAGDFYDGINIYENYIPDLGLSDEAVEDENGGDAIEGDTAIYSVIVSNAGPAPAEDVDLVVPVPTNAQYAAGTAEVNGSAADAEVVTSVLTIPVGQLLRGESIDVSYGLVIDESISSYDITVISNEDVEGVETSMPGFTVEPAPEEPPEEEEEENNGGGGGGGGGGGSSGSSQVSSDEASTIAALEITIKQLQQILADLLAGRAPSLPLPTTSPSSSSSYARDLTLGDTGVDVTQLQLFLIQNNKGPKAQALASVSATGLFGPLTQAALAEYQAAVGIAPTAGYFGPLTREYVTTH